jgi:hypothetical protein
MDNHPVKDRSKYEAIAAATGAKLTDGTDGSLFFEGKIEGETFEVYVPVEHPERFRVSVSGAPRWFMATFRRTSRKDALHKRWFGDRRRTGDARFDSDVFVVSFAEHRALMALLGDAAARQSSMALLDRDLIVSISIENVTAKPRESTVALTAELLRECVPRLAVLKKAARRTLPEEEPARESGSIAPAWLVRPPRAMAARAAQWRVAAEWLWRGLWVVGFLPMLLWVPRDKGAWIALAIVESLVLVPFALYGVFEPHDRYGDDDPWDKGASWSMSSAIQWFSSCFIALFYAAPIAIWLTLGLNAVGSDPPVAHRTEVVALRRGGVVELRSWREGEPTVRALGALGVSFRVGDPALVRSYRGLFGWEFIGRVELAPDESASVTLR